MIQSLSNFFKEHEWIALFFQSVFFLYVASVYFVLSIISWIATRVLKSRIIERDLLPNHIFLSHYRQPSVTILAPAHNEESSVVDNIISLLHFEYANYQLVVINDGSNDKTKENVLHFFEMFSTNFTPKNYLEHKPIKAIYKSKNPNYSRLTFVDKVNGGKADALNAGLEIATTKYIMSIDVDCILTEQTIIRMLLPVFRQDPLVPVVAVGGFVMVANNCKINRGKVAEINLPNNPLEVFQVLEYFRAFSFGRVPFLKNNSLVLISGAIGLFDREIIMKIKGYNKNTIGEDFELVVRMRKYMFDNNLPHSIEFVPEPHCWTEVPSDRLTLFKQRVRWTTGLYQVLFLHSNMFLRKKYKAVGTFAFPYYFFIEALTPIMETFGILFALTFALFGFLNIKFFLIQELLVISFSLLLNIVCIKNQMDFFHLYTKKRHILKLLIYAVLDPFIFHWFNLFIVQYSSIKWIFGKKVSWGTLKRKGFAH